MLWWLSTDVSQLTYILIKRFQCFQVYYRVINTQNSCIGYSHKLVVRKQTVSSILFLGKHMEEICPSYIKKCIYIQLVFSIFNILFFWIYGSNHARTYKLYLRRMEFYSPVYSAVNDMTCQVVSFLCSCQPEEHENTVYQTMNSTDFAIA